MFAIGIPTISCMLLIISSLMYTNNVFIRYKKVKSKLTLLPVIFGHSFFLGGISEFLAMNVPRRYANRVAVMGEAALGALSDSEKVWVARQLKPLNDEYKKRFIQEMGGARPGPMMRFNPENLYKAQCLKDDTMAESIAEFLEKHPGIKIISYQGDFHSDYSLGIVKKLKLLNSSVKVSVVSIIPVKDLGKIKIESFKNRADFLIFVQEISKG